LGVNRAFYKPPDLLVHTTELYEAGTIKVLDELTFGTTYNDCGTLVVENSPTFRGGAEDTLEAVYLLANRGIQTMCMYDIVHYMRELRARGYEGDTMCLWRMAVARFEHIIEEVERWKVEEGLDQIKVGLHYPIGGLAYDAIPVGIVDNPEALRILAEVLERHRGQVERIVVENQMLVRDYFVGGTRARWEARVKTRRRMEAAIKRGVMVG
jgi:hypothetical protein